jgi:predicted deacylase
LEPFVIDSLRCDPGSTAKGFLDMSELPDGTKVRLPLILIHGTSPGPRLWLQAAIHGDEYDGTMALLDISKIINPERLSGTLILIPITNITAFNSYSRTSPIDNLDMNRVFPGNPEGRFTEQYAYKLLEKITEHADYLVDIHSGGAFFRVLYWSIYHAVGGAVEERSRDLASAMLAPAPKHPPKILWKESGELLARALFVKASERGIPSCLFEGHGGGQAEFIEKGMQDPSPQVIKDGILNVLRALNMYEGTQVQLGDKDFESISDLIIYPSPFGGLFRPLVKLGDKVNKGQTIAIVEGVHGDRKEVVSVADAIIVAVRTFPVVSAGTWIFELGKV